MTWRLLIRRFIEILVMMLVRMLVYRLELAAKQNRIKTAGGVPAMGAPMPKLVFDYG
jgi:Tfp pilus assembly protein PilO